MTTFLAWLVTRIRPREGWSPFFLILTALLCFPAALSVRDESLIAGSLGAVTVLGVIIGLRLAHSRISSRRAALLGGLLGLVLSVLITGRLLPPIWLLISEIGKASDWYKNWRQGILGWPLPLASTAEFVWQQVSALGIRLWWWAQAIPAGGRTQDRIVLLLLAVFVAWAIALFATWQIFRRRSALVGLMPTGLITAVLAFFKGGTAILYLTAFLFCTLWLVALGHLWTHRQRWEQNGTDYPDNLGTELLLSLAPMLTLVLLVAAFSPVVYANPVRDAFWRTMDAPWSRVEQVAERLFGPIESGEPLGRDFIAGGGSGSLPRYHLLGSGPELGETIVLYASTNDPPPPLPAPNDLEEAAPTYPHRYWRGATYDTYTGLGWRNDPLDTREVSPSQSLTTSPARGADLVQHFQRIQPHQDPVASPSKGLIYAAGSPVRVDISVQTWLRSPDDLAFLTGEAETYTVASFSTEPTIAELRASSPISVTFPPEIASRYLALPDTIPQRVLELARELGGDAPTLYDRSRSIELYLRTYPYNLDLPDLPADRDLVDYFLFDLQEGYCDYYASAMVVLARAVGVPARLASGYAQGTYDHQSHRWVVTEQDGHSWVEVYFNGIGWVDFEPTGGRPGLERPGGEDPANIALPPLPPRTTRWWQRVPWGLILLGGAMLLLVAAIAWIWRPRPAPAAADLVRDRQARLLRWGERLGLPLRDGQTPEEYGRFLGKELRVRGHGSRLSQARQASAEAMVEIQDLSEAFIRAQYSADPIRDHEAWQVRALWTRLRRHLLWLWLAPRYRPKRNYSQEERT
ncbi:MAG TPA: transglutaminase domain-containing protein [Anaerolineae bacterium]|nr:transglutaminase domain-containing protein [Anaerolineae bacterium]